MSPPVQTDAIARVAKELPSDTGVRWYRAPGRVNLIGDHTDYNDGYVLPLAIDRWCVVAARPHTSVRVRSLDLGDVVLLPSDGSVDPATVPSPWGKYVAGVVRQLALLGRPSTGMDAVLASSVPLGSGLSSSAALEVACAVALGDSAEWAVDPVALAEACRAAEEEATGVPCGIMDQLASVAGRENSALLIDCRSRGVRAIELPDELAVLVVHSGVERTLAATEYAGRRRACEELARELGVRALRDASEKDVVGSPLGRHVVTENRRVLEAADALARPDFVRMGRLLTESHASLRDDFGVSTAELDILVDLLVRAGAYGARLTGAGFGGCVVAICDAGSTKRVLETALPRYRERVGVEGRALVCRAVEGAGRFGATNLTRNERSS